MRRLSCDTVLGSTAISCRLSFLWLLPWLACRPRGDLQRRELLRLVWTLKQTRWNLLAGHPRHSIIVKANLLTNILWDKVRNTTSRNNLVFVYLPFQLRFMNITRKVCYLRLLSFSRLENSQNSIPKHHSVSINEWKMWLRLTRPIDG